MSKTFGIKELAKTLGIEEASVRVRLRNEKIKKDGKSYSWNKGEFDKVAAQLKNKKTPGKESKPAPKKPKKMKIKKKEEAAEEHKEAA